MSTLVGINLCAIVLEFGRYIKFYIVQDLVQEEVSHPSTNAFSVMMAASANLSRQHHPSFLNARNRHDKLYNDILSWIISQDLKWKADEVEGVATKFVRVMCDTMWYIDQHHHTLADRGCHIPTCFERFTDYNLPEHSKHRKRQSSSLSGDTLRAHSERLFGCLHARYWERQGWGVLKVEVEILARSLVHYSELLSSKKERIAELHTSPSPARDVGNSMTMQYIPRRVFISSVLTPLQDALSVLGMDTPLELDTFLPHDRRKRYDYLQLYIEART